MRAFVWELWDRNRYGTVALAMIRGFPLFGVGIGCFHLMVGDFTTAPLIADNAQNWYRHQIAELGLFGSLGWLAWVAAFAWFVVRRRAAEPAVASVVRAMLVGFGFISLFGMPAQSPAVSFTFWTVAFWYVSIVGAPPTARISARGWGVVLIIAAIFTLGTARQATTELRVASRAQRVGFPYSYGFHYPEPDAAGGEFRWAKQRAAVVLDAPMRVLIVSVWVSHQDMAANPVEVKVWRDGNLAIDTTLRDGSRATTAVLLPADQRRVVLDTWASRAVRPSDFGVADARELGLMVKWEFAAQLPRGYESVPATR